MRTLFIAIMAVVAMVFSAPTMALDLIIGQKHFSNLAVAQVTQFSGTGADGVSYANQKALDEGPKRSGNMVHHAIIVTGTGQTGVWDRLGNGEITYASFSVPIDISNARAATLQIMSMTTHQVLGVIPSVTFSLWVKPGIVASATRYIKIQPNNGWANGVTPASFAISNASYDLIGGTSPNGNLGWPTDAELVEYGIFHYDFRDRPFSYARIDFAKREEGLEDVAALFTVYEEPGS